MARWVLWYPTVNMSFGGLLCSGLLLRTRTHGPNAAGTIRSVSHSPDQPRRVNTISFSNDTRYHWTSTAATSMHRWPQTCPPHGTPRWSLEFPAGLGDGRLTRPHRHTSGHRAGLHTRLRTTIPRTATRSGSPEMTQSSSPPGISAPPTTHTR